jgi:hypothetical protein
MGIPTDKLLRSVESKDTSTHFAAADTLVVGLITQSNIGFPYFVSPV